MRRPLIRSSAFVRAARRFLKVHPRAAEGLRAALEQLAEDASHPSLRTHKLKGDLAGSWACSAGGNRCRFSAVCLFHRYSHPYFHVSSAVFIPA